MLRRDLLPHQAAVLALPVALLLGVALVVLGLALGERDLGLDPAALVVEVERNEGEALLLDLADQAPDLLLVHEQLLGPVGFGLDMGRRAAERVDAAADQPQLAVADDDVAVGQLHLAGTDRLDLPAGEDHPRLVPLLDVVLEAGTAVLGDRHRSVGRGRRRVAQATPTIWRLYEAGQEVGAPLVCAARDLPARHRRRGVSAIPAVVRARRGARSRRRGPDGAASPRVFRNSPRLHDPQRPGARRVGPHRPRRRSVLAARRALALRRAAGPRRSLRASRRAPAGSSSRCAMRSRTSSSKRRSARCSTGSPTPSSTRSCAAPSRCMGRAEPRPRAHPRRRRLQRRRPAARSS